MSSELDKFKRRVIRSVARVTRQGGQDSLADQKMWDDLQKEVGCDCKLLWERMRTLTTKKLRRLLPAEDRLRSIADVAQMQLTDWLLFDLVLVHEDLDVITDDPDSKCMKDLLKLVQMFEIEGKSGDALTTAWTAATFYYNSFGRQCSPMLLQRRWYQLKKAARDRCYTFWFQYRGNARLLDRARETLPTSLHSLIAERYPYVVTKPFKEWNELIQEKFVILPEEFEAKMRSTSSTPSKSDDKNEPDLVLLEPQIETIDLGVDSDSENNPSHSKDVTKKAESSKTTEAAMKIKQEIEEQEDIELESTEAFQENDTDEEGEPNNQSLQNTEATQSDPADSENSNDVQARNNKAIIKISDDIAAVENDKEINLNTTALEDNDIVKYENTEDDLDISYDNNSVIPVETFDSNISEISDEVQEVNPTIGITDSHSSDMEKTEKEEMLMPQIMNVFGNVNVKDEILASLPLASSATEPEIVRNPAEITVECIDELIKRKTDEFTKTVVKPQMKFKDFQYTEIDVNETPPNIGQSADADNIVPATKDEYNVETIDSVTTKLENTSAVAPFEDIPTDLTFEDDGIELIDDGIEYDEEDDDVEIHNQTPCKNEKSDENPKFDLKLLMHPVVYSMKLENMTIFKNRDISEVRDKVVIDTAIIESKPTFPRAKVKKENDSDESQRGDSTQSSSCNSEDEECIPESSKVKVSSYLLQKPRSRSYNPIQLCKNPDFNTRLKRLTFSFLSSMRNRSLLKMLKPMTIDLSKAFEEKLIDGTMYLKSGDGIAIKSEKTYDAPNEQAIAVLPSAMPVQSLIDNTNVNIRDIMQPAPVQVASKPQDAFSTERQRTINLPDINHIRRINQQLLTAEVTPMRINKNYDKVRPPVQLVVDQQEESLVVDQSKDIFDASDNRMKTSVSPLNEEHLKAEVTSVDKESVVDAASEDLIEKGTVTPSNDDDKPVHATSSSSSVTDKKKTLNNTNKPVKARPAYDLPWNKPRGLASDTSSGLLTLDALQKILSIVSDDVVPENTKKGGKVLKALKKRKLELEKRMIQYEEKLKCPDKTENEVVAVEDETASKTEDTESAPEEAPKKKVKINVIRDKPYGDFCCWARLKLAHMDTSKKDNSSYANKRHRCPYICECCCREELARKTKWFKIKQTRKQDSEIVISDDEDAQKTSGTSETVVRQSAKKKFYLIEKDSRKVNSQTNASKQAEIKEVSIQCDLEQQSEITAESVAETSLALQSILPIETPVRKRATPLVRVAQPIRQHRMPAVTTQSPFHGMEHADDSILRGRLGTRERQILSKCFPKIAPAITPRMIVPPILNKPINMQGRIIIDGTKKLTVDKNPVSSPSVCIKISNDQSVDKKVYINKAKGVSSPIYLGKNKILLTDIKFPSWLNETSKAEKQPVASVQPTPVLPSGTNLVLLPDGTITYTVNPGVVLSDEQKATLPVIIAAVKEQILNSSDIQTIALNNTGVTSSNIVNPAGCNDSGNIELNNTGIGSTAVTDLTEDIEPEKNISPGTLTDGTETNSPRKPLLASTGDTTVTQEVGGVETLSAINANDVTVNTSEPVGNMCDATAQNRIEDEAEPLKEKLSDVIDDALNTQAVNTLAVNDAVMNSAVLEKEGDSSMDKSEEVSQNTVELQDMTENVEKDKEPADHAINSNRKSLLSDLMQMSGIWDDIDTSVAPDENAVNAAEIPPAVPHIENLPAEAVGAVESTSVVSPHVLTPGIIPTEITTQSISTDSLFEPTQIAENIIPMSEADKLTGLSSLKQLSSLDPALPELTPITSFAHLRYACEHNGNFFKLDLNIGKLTSGIRVCIKKQMPKSVIDLTEDDEDDEQVQITQEAPVETNLPPKTYALSNHFSRSLLKRNLHSELANVAKPLKLFKSARILKKNKTNSGSTPRIDLPLLTHPKGNKRKQNMSEVRNLGQSPILIDENSIDSSDLDQYIYKDSDFLDSSIASDSSEDEPLSVKAKRMRMSESKAIPQQSAQDAEVTEAVAENVEYLEEEEDTMVENLPQEDNDLSENLVQELPQELLPFLPGDSDGNDDDCILGV